MTVRILSPVELGNKLQELFYALSTISHLPYSNQHYYFPGFGITSEEIELFGTEDAAVNHALEITFCKEGRGEGIKLKECGPDLTAVVEVLRHYNTKFPGNAVLQKWVWDLIDAAEKAGGSATAPLAELSEPCTGEKRKISHTDTGQQKKPQISSTTRVLDWYVDIDPTEAEGNKGKGGRKADPLLDELRVFCRLRGDPSGQKYVRCIAAIHGCEHRLTDKSGFRERVLRHAAVCHYLSQETKHKVYAAMGKQALGNIVSSEQVLSRSSGTLDNWAGSAGRQQHDIKINLAVLKILCVRGVPPTIVDSPEWKELLRVLAPKHKPTSAKTFTETLIPHEAAAIKLKQIELLRKQSNLTISFDGNTTTGLQSIYTVHVITPDRRVFLLDGNEASDTSHTAEYIARVLKSVMNDIGPQNFKAITSDNTGNTSAARLLIRRDYPWMIVIPDPCHRLNLLCKDIGRIPHFATTIKSVQRTIKYFRKATHATAILRKKREEHGIPRGLQSIGKTRFGTVYHAALSVEQNFQAISDLAKEKVISVPEVSSLFHPNNLASTLFQFSLRELTAVLAPAAKAITCLESAHSTVSDVYVFWLAVTAETHRLITGGGLTNEIKESIRKAVNYRFNQMVNEAPSDVFFCGFVLDPRFRDYNILMDLNPLAIRKIKLACNGTSTYVNMSAELPEALKRAGLFLKGMLREEYRESERAIAGLTVSEAVARLKDQLVQFRQGEYPFNVPFSATKDTHIAWWKTLDNDPSNIHQPLARLARTLFALLPNSMSDERTASTFTWLNSRLRNRQDAQTLVDLTRVRQWYLLESQKKKEPFRPTVRFADLSAMIPRADTSIVERDMPHPSNPVDDSKGTEQKEKEDDLGEEAQDIEDELLDDEGSDDIPDTLDKGAVSSHLKGQVDLSSPVLLGLLSGDEPIVNTADKYNKVVDMTDDFDGPTIDINDDKVWSTF